MKDINFEKSNFRQLVSSRNLGLPDYQRKYDWGEEQWEELIQSVVYYIDKNKIREEQEKEEGRDYYWDIYYFGSIILERHEGKNFYEIIDGQQRIITYFIILFIIYEKINELEKFRRDRIEEIKKEIKIFTLSPRGEIKLELRNEKERKSFRKICPFFTKLKEIKENSRFDLAKKYFLNVLSEISKEDYSLTDVFDTLTDKFTFLVIKPETEPNSSLQEMFVALNSTGLDLNISDLLRNLFITKLRNLVNILDINEKWEEIEDNIAGPKRFRIDRKMQDFLLNFWVAWFTVPILTKTGRTLKISRLNLYELFRNRLHERNTTEQQTKKTLEEISTCAILNKNIEKPSYVWWKDNGWEIGMFNFVENVNVLGLKQIISLIFVIHSRYKEVTRDEKEDLINNLNMLLIYMFRLSIIKSKTAISIHNLLVPLIKGIKAGQKINENEEVNRIIEAEFNPNSTEIFYQELSNYQTKNNNFWRFIFRTFYQKKYNELIREKKISVKLKTEDFYLEKFEVEHLVSLKDRENLNFSLDDFEEIKFRLGNITLLRKEDNARVSNKLWMGSNGKREYFLAMGENCFLSWEKWNIINLSKITPEDIRTRGEKLLEEFRKSRVFEKGI